MSAPNTAPPYVIFDMHPGNPHPRQAISSGEDCNNQVRERRVRMNENERKIVENSHTPQHPLWLSVVLSLFPGVVLGAFIVGTAPLLKGWGLDPIFALFGGIGLVIVPLELGCLAIVTPRTTGSWSPFALTDYKSKLPPKRLLPIAIGLVVWFILTLIAWTSLLEGWVIDRLPSWVPDSIRQFAQTNADD